MPEQLENLLFVAVCRFVNSLNVILPSNFLGSCVQMYFIFTEFQHLDAY